MSVRMLVSILAIRAGRHFALNPDPALIRRKTSGSTRSQRTTETVPEGIRLIQTTSTTST